MSQISSGEQRSYQVDGKLVPCGYKQISPATATNLPGVPKDARAALIQARVQAIRWRDDGVAPTADVGMYLAPGFDMLYVGDLRTIQLIEVDTSAEVNVSYYH